MSHMDPDLAKIDLQLYTFRILKTKTHFSKTDWGVVQFHSFISIFKPTTLLRKKNRHSHNSVRSFHHFQIIQKISRMDSNGEQLPIIHSEIRTWQS